MFFPFFVLKNSPFNVSEYSLRTKELLTLVVYEKTVLYVLKFRAQKLAI